MHPSPCARVQPVLACDPISGSIYLLGGHNYTYPHHEEFTDLWRYDPPTKEWTLLLANLAEHQPLSGKKERQRREGNFPMNCLTSRTYPVLHSHTNDNNNKLQVLLHDCPSYLAERSYFCLLNLKEEEEKGKEEKRLKELRLQPKDNTLENIFYIHKKGSRFYSIGGSPYAFQYRSEGEGSIGHTNGTPCFDIFHMSIENGDEDGDGTIEWECISKQANEEMDPQCRETVKWLIAEHPLSFAYSNREIGVISMGYGIRQRAANRVKCPSSRDLDAQEREDKKKSPLVLFDVLTRQFSSFSTHPDPHKGFPLYASGMYPLVVGARLYLVGGERSNVYRSNGVLMEAGVWSLDLGDRRWIAPTGQLKLNVPVAYHTAIYSALDSCIWAFGGQRVTNGCSDEEQRALAAIKDDDEGWGKDTESCDIMQKIELSK